MKYTIRQGSSAGVLRFLLRSASNEAAVCTGLDPAVNELCAAFIRDDEPEASQIALRFWDVGAPAEGAFREIDAQRMPGMYELLLPDQVCAAPARTATVMVTGTEIVPCVLHLDLVAYDPYDSHALGLDCLSREHRHATISSAFREVVPDIVDEFRRRESQDK